MSESTLAKDFSKRTELLSDIIIGLSDGLIVPLALATGLSVAGLSTTVVTITCGAWIALGAIVMGRGGYAAAKEEMENFEENTGGHHPTEGNEREFLANLGLNKEMQDKAILEMREDRRQWAEFTQQYQLASAKPDAGRPIRSALTISSCYILGGVIAIMPFLFAAVPLDGLKIAIPVTLVSLFIFGFIKGRMTDQSPWAWALRSTIVGALAAGGAYSVAYLISS